MFARDELIEDALALEPLPASSAQLAQLLAKEDWTLDEVVQAVALDQALTGRILCYANSAAGGSKHEISSVGTAVMRMGPRMVMSIALGDALKGKVNALNDAEVALWRHSVASALAIEVMHKAGLRSPGGTFTAALVHDVGKLVIGRKLRAMGIKLATEHPDTPWVDEAEQLGIDHAELSGSIVRSWELSDDVSDAVDHHHAAHLLEDGTAKTMARFVAAADAVAHSLDDEDEFWNPLITTYLGLSPQDQNKIRNATRKLVDGVMQAYS